jgi:hypothetical protein
MRITLLCFIIEAVLVIMDGSKAGKINKRRRRRRRGKMK